MAIKIITDSASDIDGAEAKGLGIEMIPMAVTFGSEEYYDGETLTKEEFYRKLTKEKGSPKTSQITPFRFEEAFGRATKAGDEVIAILLSSGLSGTYEGAVRAAEKFKGKVFVLDSLSATVGERLLCQYALRLIGCGRSAKEIFEALESAKKRLCVMGVPATLEYLKRGGRISGAAALVGSMFDLKPIISVVDGRVKAVGKARGQKKSGELMTALVKARGGIDFSMPYGVLWTGLDEEAAARYIESSAELWEGHSDVPAYIVGSTIGTHIGPGAFGLAFFQKNQ